jgi:hypothetical protein
MYLTRLEKFAKDRYSCFFGLFISEEENKVFNIGNFGQFKEKFFFVTDRDQIGEYI